MKHICFFVILSFLCIPVSPQVTIGSSMPPPSGTLLSLKENENINANSTKGILLPRVALTDRTKLYPMFEEGEPEYSGVFIERTNLAHVGLLVFNITVNTDLKKGIFVWDGTEWTQVIGVAEGGTYLEDEVIDHEGNTYPIGKFGDAGVWTLQNMRATTYPDGTQIPFAMISDKDNPNWSILERIHYPDAIDNSTTPPQHHSSKYGMLYSYNAAIAGSNEVDESITLRGVCPRGWHIPTDKEWLALEKELDTNYIKYATSQIDYSPSWSSEFETEYSEGSRGQYGKIFKSSTRVVRDENNSGEAEIPATNGFSLSAEQKGFDAYLAGVYVAGENESQNDYNLRFGIVTQFWTRTLWHTQNPENPGMRRTVRKLNATEVGVDRNYSNTKALLSVRCKRD